MNVTWILSSFSEFYFVEQYSGKAEIMLHTQGVHDSKISLLENFPVSLLC